MPKGSERESGVLTKPSHDKAGRHDSWTEPSNRERERSSGTTPSDGLRSHMDMDVRDGSQIESAGQSFTEIPSNSAMFPDLPERESRRPGGLMELGLGDRSSLGQSHGPLAGQKATHAGSSREPWSTRERHVHDGRGRGVTDYSHSHIPNVQQFTDDLVWGPSDHPDQQEQLLAQVDHLTAMNARAHIDHNFELLGWLAEPDAAPVAAAVPPPPLQNNIKAAPAMRANSAEQSHHGSQLYTQPPPPWPQPSSVREPKDEEEDLPLPWNYTYSYAKINRYISRQRHDRVFAMSNLDLAKDGRNCRREHADGGFAGNSESEVVIGTHIGEKRARHLSLNRPFRLTQNSTLAVYELLEEDSAVRMFEVSMV
ncbi:hypothetical protein QFC24_006654 [Naganishia onofrii]|uniref:Uncharacterized protein n=1 Tax=Naganishia onofrii TaxID=1851511 RepID=A0ACC2WZ70_9TREE|nr:hypothetical protein QFC24_006654 [Naganishia onofrii]